MTTKTREHQQPHQRVWVKRSLVLSQQESKSSGSAARSKWSSGGAAFLHRSKSYDDNTCHDFSSKTPVTTTTTTTTTPHLARSKSEDGMNVIKTKTATTTTTTTTPLRRFRRGHANREQPCDDKSDLTQSTTTTTTSTTTTNSSNGSSCSSSSSSTSSIATDDVSLSSTCSFASLPWQSTPYEWVPGVLLSSTGDKHKTNNGNAVDEDDTSTNTDKDSNDNRMLYIRILPDKQQYQQSSSPADDFLSNNKNHTTLTVPASKLHTDVHYANPSNQQAPDDLTTLQHFHEPALVACLQQRFERQIVYTKTGPILIAVNPFVHLEHLYCDARMQQYWRKAEEASAEPLSPHVYAMADDAFRSMMRAMEMNMHTSTRTARKNQISTSNISKKRKLDQSILVSGESGAGKTVTVKYIMKYLAALSQRASRAATSAQRAYQQVSSNTATTAIATATTKDASSFTDNMPASSKRSCASIEAQVLQSNPILESFGNARTVRNDNSSRFGKFIEMQFTATGRLIGTQIKTYLLEKVRVVHISAGERNYHIFYELLQAKGGLSTDQLAQLHLLKADGACWDPSEFALLSASGTFVRRDGVSDAETFRNLKMAMTMMGFNEQDRWQVFATAAAILHASNLKFEAEADNQEDGCHLQKDSVHLEAVCDLFGVSATALNDALCYRSIKAAGKSIQSPLNQVKAQKGLDALLKSTYGALFTFLVQRVNASIAATTEPSAVIGVLDIFGFETFAVNSFEQLCINYCNEVLQQQFNTFMLKNEQVEYASEGIVWDFIKFPENQDVLELLDDRTNGIMSILDDMCKAPGATDKSFAIEVVKRCESLSRFEACYKKSAPYFSIQHYAGTVEYSTDCFVEKNRDDLPRETSMFLMGSSNPFVHKLAEIIARDHNNVDVLASGNNAKSSSRPTVGGQFRRQVKELRTKIDSTSPHYVRCIKPNAMLVPDRFDCEMVVNQLRCGGVLQAVSVTRDGFTLHYTHAEFLDRYRGLLHGSKGFVTTSPSTRTAVQEEARALVDGLLKRIEKMEISRIDDGNSKSTTGEDKTKGSLIQFGKSKVLLKHHAFEALEAMLGAMQNECATRLNAIFRRFLCRVAFLSVRQFFREGLRQKGQTFDEWFKEHRELYYQPRSKSGTRDSMHIPNIVKARMEMFKKASSVSIQKSFSSKKGPLDLVTSAWMLQEGLWARNPDYCQSHPK